MGPGVVTIGIVESEPGRGREEDVKGSREATFSYRKKTFYVTFSSMCQSESLVLE